MIKYLIIMNLIALILCCFDKYLAIKRKYRISEKILLGICLIGGVFGFSIASRIVRHKTKDKKFLLIMYPILVVWIFIIIFFYDKII